MIKLYLLLGGNLWDKRQVFKETIALLEELVGSPVEIISVGPDRDQTVVC